MHSSVNLQQDGAPNATADKNPTESTSGDSANTKAAGQEAKEASDETSTSSSESPPAETSTQSTANKDRGSGSNAGSGDSVTAAKKTSLKSANGQPYYVMPE